MDMFTKVMTAVFALIGVSILVTALTFIDGGGSCEVCEDLFSTYTIEGDVTIDSSFNITFDDGTSAEKSAYFTTLIALTHIGDYTYTLEMGADVGDLAEVSVGVLHRSYGTVDSGLHLGFIEGEVMNSTNTFMKVDLNFGGYSRFNRSTAGNADLTVGSHYMRITLTKV